MRKSLRNRIQQKLTRQLTGHPCLDLMKLLKKSLDPLGILNPGKIFD